MIPIGPSYLRGHLLLAFFVALAALLVDKAFASMPLLAVYCGLAVPLLIDPWIWRMVARSLTIAPERFLGQWGRAIGLEILLLVFGVLVGLFAFGLPKEPFLLALVTSFLLCTAHRVHRLLGLKGLVENRPQASPLETA